MLFLNLKTTFFSQILPQKIHLFYKTDENGAAVYKHERRGLAIRFPSCQQSLLYFERNADVEKLGAHFEK